MKMGRQIDRHERERRDRYECRLADRQTSTSRQADRQAGRDTRTKTEKRRSDRQTAKHACNGTLS